MKAVLPLAALALTFSATAEPLTVREDFEDGAGRWKATAPENWRVTDTDRGRVFELFDKAARYQPPFRSPFNFALLQEHQFGDFTLTAEVKTTARSYGHRDIVVVFGYQDPAHFYYAHFGEKADDHSCQVFIVNEAPRTKISTRETEGIPWQEDRWHRLKIVRKVSDGSVKVYFDNMDEPVLEAKDSTFSAGQIGLGSFDDTAQFDNVVIEGEVSGSPGADASSPR